MSLPIPPRYVVLPQDVIEQAYAPEKPRRALLASFARILSLAWEAKYQHTPALNEDELMEFLKLSRRQYFEQKADMELLQWLRSSHPRPGFVQFTFSRSVSEKLVQDASAENRTDGAENRTELMRIEEDESIEFKKQESSSSSSLTKKEVRKIALTASEEKMQVLLENLHLLFDPEVHGLLDIRGPLLAGIPDRALAWIAKSYQDRERLASPIGLIVKHVLECDEPNRYFLNKYGEILPENYLEAVGEISYSCAHCDEIFDKRTLLDEHVKEFHRICMECGQAFDTEDLERAHYAAKHDPYRKPAAPEPIVAPALDGSIETAWQVVLAELQKEMPRASFETWVRDTKPVRYHGNVLEIGTRNSYARDWLTDRMTATIQKLLVGLMRKEITVTFVVDSEMVIEVDR